MSKSVSMSVSVSVRKSVSESVTVSGKTRVGRERGAIEKGRMK